MEPHIEKFIRVFGASADSFAARQFTTNILVEQDLVLAMTRGHRSLIVELAPSLLKRTFTHRELTRILPQLYAPHGLTTAERWTAVISLALRARTLQGHNPEDDDVADPYRREDDVFERMRHEITPAVQALIHWEQGGR